jgi:hypothetical protein
MSGMPFAVRVRQRLKPLPEQKRALKDTVRLAILVMGVPLLSLPKKSHKASVMLRCAAVKTGGQPSAPTPINMIFDVGGKWVTIWKNIL